MEPTKVTKPKDKRRNNEKRKEKSRDAARCRRSRETEIFSELAGALPLSKDVISQLDKASVMRLAISYLKIRNIATILPEIEQPKEKSQADTGSVFLKALDGFMMVLSDEGDIAYLSENVKDFLGISQVDLMGQNIYDYSHMCDHEEVRDILATKTNQKESLSKSFFLRLKCTHTSKGRNVNLKSASYKVIHFSGHILPEEDEKSDKDDESSSGIKHKSLIAIGQPIPHPSNIEVPLDKKTFLSKHSLDMKFTYADEKMLEVLGFDPEELLGKSIYEYHHALDSEVICSRFKTLFSKGQCETTRYRFLAKEGGYVWVVTQATVLHDKFHKAQSVVCVHHVISGIECSGEIYSVAQELSATTPEEVKENIPVVIEEKNIKEIECDIKDTKDNIPKIVVSSPPVLVETEKREKKENIKPTTNIGISALARCTTNSLFKAERPQTATSKIFNPRTEEMNKGFLIFSEEEPGLTILKDEPDDLTHLAPTAGDVCVPLADNPFFTEMFDDFMLDANYCPLLTDDLGSLDSSQCSSKTGSTNNSVTSDPFMAYRDDFDLNKSELSNSPQLLSPNNMSHSPGSSLPSLCSPGTSLHEDDQLKTFMSLQMDSEEDSQFSSKAPYISMSVTDDLPLLNVSEDLMWGALPEEKSPKPIIKTETTNSSSFNSSLAQLLCQKTNNQKSNTYKTHDHGGGLLNISDFVYQKYTETKEIPDNWILQDPNSLIHIHNKSPPEMTPVINNKPVIKQPQNERPQKRINAGNNSQYGTISKRCKNEPKEKLSSELLNQLMSNNTPNRSSTQSKQKRDWCNSRTEQHPPSDSVLMNLLDSKKKSKPTKMDTSPPIQDILDKRLPNISVLLGNRMQKIDQKIKERHEVIRKNSFSLLDPEGKTIPSLLDLSEQDYDVNAPVNTALLQGYELLNALEYSDPLLSHYKSTI